MINGRTARLAFIFMAGLAGILIVGMVLLATLDRPIPPELSMALTGIIGFLAGTNFTPPGYNGKTSTTGEEVQTT